MKHSWILVAGLAVAACGGKKSGAAKDQPAAQASPPPGPVEPPPPLAPLDVPAGGLTIPAVPPKVGDKVVETNQRTMVTKVEVEPGKSVEVTTTEHREEAKEVVEVADGIITKLKVAYPAFTITEVATGKVKPRATPTVGKAYLVWRDGGAFKASLADGGPISPEELQMLGKHQKSVGRPDVMQQIFVAHTWKVGEQVAMTPDELARLAQVIGGEDDDGSQLKAMGVALQSADAKVAVFSITMVLETTGPKGGMKMSLTGVAKMDRAAGRTLEVKVAGPFAGSMGMTVSGTMDAVTSYAY